MATQIRRPDADGIRSNWTPNHGGDLYVEVDEETHDSDTSYLYRDDSASNFTLEHAPFDIDSTSINKVTVYAVLRVAGAYYVYWDGQLVVGGTVYTSDGGTYPGNSQTYTLYSVDFLTNPNTSNDWTEAEVEQSDGTNDLTEHGVQSASHGSGEQIRCTQCYVEVDYEGAAVTPIAKQLEDSIADEWELL